jgi:predicted nucleic acid-binding Zn ribbon protein
LRNDPRPSADHRSCRACGRSFAVQGRQVWCSDACRQRGFRLRQRQPDERFLDLATRLPKTVIVYQCPECEARFLGQQRCDDCGIFCRRLGPGGHCPYCDEAVAVTDLLAANLGGAIDRARLSSRPEVMPLT